MSLRSISSTDKILVVAQQKYVITGCYSDVLGLWGTVVEEEKFIQPYGCAPYYKVLDETKNPRLICFPLTAIQRIEIVT